MNWLFAILLMLFAATTVVTLALYLVWHYERLNYPLTSEWDEPLLLHSIAAVIVESACIFLFAITTPLRVFHDLGRLRKKGDDTPIILLHGFGGSSANMALIRIRLILDGHRNVYAFSYNPPTANVWKLAKQVGNFTHRVLDVTGAEKVDMIGHSMGGVIIRHVIAHENLRGKVRRAVTLGSPHRGSKVANMLYNLGAAGQMRHDSEFFRALNQDGLTPGVEDGTEYCSIYSSFDNFVIPHDSSDLGSNATNIHLAYHGHCALLYSPLVYDQLKAFLDKPDTAPGPVSQQA